MEAGKAKEERERENERDGQRQMGNLQSEPGGPAGIGSPEGGGGSGEEGGSWAAALPSDKCVCLERRQAGLCTALPSRLICTHRRGGVGEPGPSDPLESRSQGEDSGRVPPWTSTVTFKSLHFVIYEMGVGGDT